MQFGMDAKRRLWTTLLLVTLTAIALCIPILPAGNDDPVIKRMDPLDTHLHLFPDSILIDTYRSFGYSLALGSQDVTRYLFYDLLNHRGTPQFEYVKTRAIHDGELITRAFHNPSHLKSLELILANDETTDAFDAVQKRTLTCWDRIITRQDKSPKIARILESNIAELERIGLGDWVGFNFELLADYYFSVKDDANGLRCLKETLRRRIATGNMPLASQAAGRIGIHYTRKGDYPEAERALLESLRYARSTEDPYYIARALAFLAELRSSQGFVSEAESLLTEAITYSRRIRDPNAQAARLVEMARQLYDLGDDRRAMELCEEGITLDDACLREPAFSENVSALHTIRRYRAEAYSIEASIHVRHGRHDAAIAAMNEAVGTARATIDRRFEASLEARLGEALVAAGRDDEALRSFRKALSTARRLGEKDKEAEYLTAVGAIFLKRKEIGRAEEQFERALDAASKSASPADDVPILYSLAKIREERHDYRTATRLLERAVAVFEREQTTRTIPLRSYELGDEIEKIFSELLLIEINRLGNGDSLLFYAEKARLLRRGGRCAGQSDLDECIRRSVRNTDWIPANTLIVQHVTTPDTMVIIATGRHGSTYRSVAVSRIDIQSAVNAFIDESIALGETGRTAPTAAAFQAVARRSRELSRLLLEPIAPLLSQSDVLCFIPDQAVQGVPFAALLDPADESRFLVEDKEVVASTSLVALHSAVSRPSPAAGAPAPRFALLVGNPRLGAELRRWYPSLNDLPFASREIAEVDSILGGCTVLTGAAATKSAVLAELPRADHVHIATHAISSASATFGAALVLAPDPQDTTGGIIESSLLTENEIRRLDLSRTMLVVVAACESAGRKRFDDSSELGIAGAFLDAGARAVVASLWPVEDRSACHFMEEYYNRLVRGGTDSGETLRSTQNYFIRGDRLSGNSFNEIQVWAPFICFESLPETK
jgi:CHAT domain-containing protein/tetratricopeptide (TPR) repeat protein